MGRHLRPVALSHDITPTAGVHAGGGPVRVKPLECHTAQYYDDWGAITFIGSAKVKHVFPGEANVTLRFTEGNDISPFWQGVLKSEMGIDAETKHTSGVEQQES